MADLGYLDPAWTLYWKVFQLTSRYDLSVRAQEFFTGTPARADDIETLFEEIIGALTCKKAFGIGELKNWHVATTKNTRAGHVRDIVDALDEGLNMTVSKIDTPLH